MDFLLIFVSILILMVSLLVAIGFVTLLERKILGYIHIRKGPNKVGYMGLVQPFSDALKLFSKEQIYPFMSNYLMYYISPIFSLSLSMFLWICLPFYSLFICFNFSFMFFLCLSSMSVYTIMLAGWSSNSNYSLLGSLRCVAQTISYEVSLSIILISILFLIEGLSIFDLVIYQNYIWFLILCFPLSMLMITSLLAESNRTPFDFAESESELVSGFNVEYSSGNFTLIFMAEYLSILFLSMIYSFMFFGGSFININFFFIVSLIMFVFIWIRGTLPRFRYDKLMYLTWKNFLPISLNYLIYYFSMKIIIFTLII